jgi:hypothetical protein
MKIRSIVRAVALVTGAFAALPARAQERLDTGTRAQIRLLDYVNTEQQPVGYTYRGIVDGSITAGGKTAIPDKASALMRLVADPRRPGDLTVEWWAVKIEGEWHEFRGSDGGKDSFTAMVNVEPPRDPRPDAKALVKSGSGLYIPFRSLFHFEIRKPVILVNVGRFRF